MRRVSPELNPPTFRCSHKYNLCSGPSASFPSATGIVFPAPHSVLLTCPGMSSRPSCVCLKNSSFHDSGTILLSARSNVSANASSALPMTSDADVCCDDAPNSKPSYMVWGACDQGIGYKDKNGVVVANAGGSNGGGGNVLAVFDGTLTEFLASYF